MSTKKMKIMMPCEEANHVCDKTQYKEATLWEKIILNIHLIYCRACRKYSKNNSKLTKKIKEAKVECLEKKCKESMKKELTDAINQHTN
ncbi:hypothetical protein [Hwangdonia lutea]|uniref:Glycine dehydrogenase n=1 Tax=Hwangdonia lutea TaxID=3075823 RepID=A0AA97EIW4_9FLAO|nr:hypothetical protein [Hwangdonia sp. SCSIO 19198]WOD42281.1 hypothetical protein RNZ46_09755 [Hwangdonia sp. SCSIO 19198]